MQKMSVPMAFAVAAFATLAWPGAAAAQPAAPNLSGSYIAASRSRASCQWSGQTFTVGQGGNRLDTGTASKGDALAKALLSSNTSRSVGAPWNMLGVFLPDSRIQPGRMAPYGASSNGMAGTNAEFRSALLPPDLIHASAGPGQPNRRGIPAARRSKWCYICGAMGEHMRMNGFLAGLTGRRLGVTALVLGIKRFTGGRHRTGRPRRLPLRRRQSRCFRWRTIPATRRRISLPAG